MMPEKIVPVMKPSGANNRGNGRSGLGTPGSRASQPCLHNGLRRSRFVPALANRPGGLVIIAMPTPRESGANLFRREFDLEETTRAGSPTVKLCHLMLAEGIEHGATSIRVRPCDDNSCGVDYEIGGAWRQVMKIPLPAFGPLVNRLKVMAALDISRQPSQRGEVHVRYKGALRVFRIETEVQGQHENVLLS